MSKLVIKDLIRVTEEMSKDKGSLKQQESVQEVNKDNASEAGYSHSAFESYVSSQHQIDKAAPSRVNVPV